MLVTIKHTKTNKRVASFITDDSRLTTNSPQIETIKRVVEIVKRHYPIIKIGKDYSVNIKSKTL